MLAVGSVPWQPDIPGIDQPHVLPAIDVLRDVSVVKGQNVVVIGGGDVGCETAVHLADAGKKVTIIEILPELMTEQYINNVKMAMYQLLNDKGIRYFTRNQVTQIDARDAGGQRPGGRADATRRLRRHCHGLPAERTGAGDAAARLRRGAPGRRLHPDGTHPRSAAGRRPGRPTDLGSPPATHHEVHVDKKRVLQIATVWRTSAVVSAPSGCRTG